MGVFSRLARLVLSLVSINENAPFLHDNGVMDGVQQSMVELIQRHERLAENFNWKVLLVILPMEWEVRRGAYQTDFSYIEKAAHSKTRIKVCNLMPCYAKSIGENAEQFYWPMDGHHTPQGYDMMAECILQAIKESNLSHDLLTERRVTE